MSKAVTNATQSRHTPTFGRDTEVLRIACDDGSTYVVERDANSPRWSVVRRIDRDGSVSVRPSRLPAAVEAHLDGVTRSGPYGVDGGQYWVV